MYVCVLTQLCVPCVLFVDLSFSASGILWIYTCVSAIGACVCHHSLRIETCCHGCSVKPCVCADIRRHSLLTMCTVVKAASALAPTWSLLLSGRVTRCVDDLEAAGIGSLARRNHANLASCHSGRWRDVCPFLVIIQVAVVQVQLQPTTRQWLLLEELSRPTQVALKVSSCSEQLLVGLLTLLLV
jgi:hypothetical protein